MKKLTLLAGAAAGYVLGARAGRERYEQIKNAASSARRNPKVQSVVDDVRTEAKVAAQQAAGQAKEKVADAMHRDDPSSTPGPNVPPPGSTS